LLERQIKVYQVSVLCRLLEEQLVKVYQVSVLCRLLEEQ
jgi:hypothetical protein